MSVMFVGEILLNCPIGSIRIANVELAILGNEFIELLPYRLIKSGNGSRSTDENSCHILLRVRVAVSRVGLPEEGDLKWLVTLKDGETSFFSARYACFEPQ